MLIIGERINTVRKKVLQAYQEKDSEYIREEAMRQSEAGADINRITELLHIPVKNAI